MRIAVMYHYYAWDKDTPSLEIIPEGMTLEEYKGQSHMQGILYKVVEADMEFPSEEVFEKMLHLAKIEHADNEIQVKFNELERAKEVRAKLNAIEYKEPL